MLPPALALLPHIVIGGVAAYGTYTIINKVVFSFSKTKQKAAARLAEDEYIRLVAANKAKAALALEDLRATMTLERLENARIAKLAAQQNAEAARLATEGQTSRLPSSDEFHAFSSDVTIHDVINHIRKSFVDGVVSKSEVEYEINELKDTITDKFVAMIKTSTEVFTIKLDYTLTSDQKKVKILDLYEQLATESVNSTMSSVDFQRAYIRYISSSRYYLIIGIKK